MCLSNAKLRYATKPIKCYKYLGEDLKPIYYDFQYELGKVYESELRYERVLIYDFISAKRYSNITRFIVQNVPNYIKDCRIHSYFTIYDWINAKDVHLNRIAEGFHTYKEPPRDYMFYRFNVYNLYECEIPAHSWYYEGEYEDLISYASDHLIVKKLYKPDENES